MSDRTDTSCNDASRSDERVTTLREAEEMLRRAERQDKLGFGGYLGCPHDLSYFDDSADVIRSLMASLAADAADEEQSRLKLGRMWAKNIRRAWRYRAELDAAVADRDRLAEAAHDLNEYASNKAGYWQHPLTEKVRAYFDALAGREGSNDA